MSILFSYVTVARDDAEVELLVGGIPHSSDDLDGWNEFDDFMAALNEEMEIAVHVEAYLYGAGETESASDMEIALLQDRIAADPYFLSQCCDNIEDTDFVFTGYPMDFGDEDEEQEME